MINEKELQENFTMQMTPNLGSIEMDVKENGRTHHYNLAKEISKLKRQLDEQEFDLVVIKTLLGERFDEAKKLVNRAIKDMIASDKLSKKVDETLNNVRNLL